MALASQVALVTVRCSLTKSCVRQYHFSLVILVDTVERF